MNHLKHSFVPERFGIFLLACNNGTLKLLKRKYREKILTNVKETIFFKVKNGLYRKNSLYKKVL